MLAREGMEHLSAQLDGPAAAQAVVEVTLTAIGVEGRAGGFGVRAVRKLPRKCLCSGELFLEPRGAEAGAEKAVEGAVAFSVAYEREYAGTLARAKLLRDAGEKAGEGVLHGLD